LRPADGWVRRERPDIPDKEDKAVGIGISIFLIAVGAILAFAVDATVSGLDIVTVGWILMGVGALGLVLSIIFWSSWGGFATTRRDTIVERDRTVL
jgi:Na+/proline symporter